MSVSAASEIADCRIALARAVARQVASYQVNIDRCLRFGAYHNCAPSYEFLANARIPLETVFADEKSPCVLALEHGASITDIGPAVCPGQAWYAPDHNAEWYNLRCSQSVTNSDALYNCLQCETEGLGGRVNYDLDIPYSVPASLNDRKCIRAAHTSLSRAVRTGVQSAILCAYRAGEPPWSCPLDLSSEGTFERSLAGIDKKIAKCRNDAGDYGIGRGAAELCNAVATTPEALAGCLRRSAKCQACLGINVALGRSDDCAAISGDPDCTYDPVKPRVGSFYVTNRDDDTVSFFGDDALPSFGTLVDSTFPTGPAPTSVAVSEKTNTLFVLNSGDDSVTSLHAGFGTPVNGTLAASTVVLGSNPAAITVNPEADVVYVANSGDATVTFLDAHDGSYAFGTLGASTFPVGRNPVALAVDAKGQILFVANADDGTVTMLDGLTGLPWFGTLANSSFDVGTEPRSLGYVGYYGYYSGEIYDATLVVADASEGVARSFDAATLTSSTDLDDASEVPLAPAPDHLALSSTYSYNLQLFALSGTSPKLLSWSENRGGDEIVIDGTATATALGVNGSLLGAGERGSDRPLMIAFGDRDELVITATGAGANAGRAPEEVSSADSNGYSALVYDPAHDRYIGIKTTGYYGDAHGYVGLIDGSDYSLLQEIPTEPYLSRVDYSLANDTLFALNSADGVTYFDAATGLPKFGTVENSTFNCGCTYMPEMAVSDVANRLYLHCYGYVAYLDAATGTCIGGSPITTGAGGGTLSSLVVDEAGSNLLVSYADGIFRLDLVSPQYRNGTLTASTLSGSSGSGYRVLRVDGLGRVYGAVDGYNSVPIRAFDIATGAMVAQSPLTYYYGYGDLDVDVATGVLRAITYNGVAYFHLSDLTFFTGDSATSTVLPYTSGALSHGTTEAISSGGTRITRLRRDIPALIEPEPDLGGITVATGHYPAGIAVMPAHTEF